MKIKDIQVGMKVRVVKVYSEDGNNINYNNPIIGSELTVRYVNRTLERFTIEDDGGASSWRAEEVELVKKKRLKECDLIL